MNANTSRSGGAVKPGDLAIVCNPHGRNHGRIVEVLLVAPSGDFVLPDGTLSEGTGHLLGFVCRGIGGYLQGRSTDRVPTKTLFMAIWSGYLRPLPGDYVPESERHAEEVEA